MTDTIHLSASLEDYLEAILLLINEKGAAKAKDIASRMKVKRPSVTGALKSLAKKDLINYSPYDVITLTEDGKTIAKQIYLRHQTLTKFLYQVLSIDANLAEETACSMEHAVPQEVLERLLAYIEFTETCPNGGATWIRDKGFHCEHKPESFECANCQNETDAIDTKTKLKENAILTLSEVKPGQKCQVSGIIKDRNLSRRLMEMGLTRGTTIEVKKVAPMGDPMEISVKGYNLSLRKNEVTQIQVTIKD
jgi:DtxR family Mn-dependent transcriptional regulator